MVDLITCVTDVMSFQKKFIELATQVFAPDVPLVTVLSTNLSEKFRVMYGVRYISLSDLLSEIG